KLLGLRREKGNVYNVHFRCMLLGGGPIDLETLKDCRQLTIPVVQSYGMTETCSQIVALNDADADSRIGSVGKPLFLTQLKLAEKNQEVLLKTPALTVGYLNRPQALPDKLTADGWYRTGDIGHFDSDGFLYIDGRIDDMIISGGENIFPDEIESVYLQRPDVDEIAVVGVDDSKWGQRAVAFVVGNQPISEPELIQFGRQRLAHYKVPKQFIQIDQLPMNAGGKVQRFKLKLRIDASL
ncbi:AMP-binding enzyme, partial [Lentilactobacillus parabuchneri]|uniref:AMP-binding enzyme n=1 Tax=Lentilactobacillus parabuchneri TaxID=152331 RepID=UPI002648C566